MADSFFGFDTTLGDGGLEDGLDCPLEEDDLCEQEYDALNDETFGSEATIGDWEKDHEKLSQITESTRSQNKSTSNEKNGINVDIEDSLSHLVLDDKEGIVPKPGVWDTSNLPLPKPKPIPSLTSTLKNVCTVEELERGLIANRPPPGLSKPVQPQQPQKSDGSFLFDALSLNDKLQINGLPTSRFPPGLGIPPPHPVVMPPNLRLPHPQFMQHPRLLSNQSSNVLRYPLPPHVMLPHGAQRQPHHGPFPGNFHHSSHPNLGHPQFLRPDHPMMPAFSNNQANHQQQHSFPHSGNQRNQNRLFYSNEQQGNHQTFFKNNQYPHRNHDRNNQRYYHYQHYAHHQGVNGISNSGEYDEYAGLMSSREKQWLINIQLLQLNTNLPYVDDYYYTVFCDRQNKKNAHQEQKDKKHSNNNGFQRDHRDREQSQLVSSKVVYTPAQFENSLGKLQFSSVTAPRKIIDMDVVPNSDPQSTPQSQQKDTKKTRQLLLEIERMYTIQLKLEDLNNPLAAIPEQQQDTENEVNTVKKTGTELIGMMLTSISQLIQDDKIASMLSIRKGKTLLLRFLPHLNVTEYSNQLEEFWTSILRSLAIIGRRDTHLLTNFYSDFRRWLDNVQDFSIVLRLAKALSESATQPVKNNSLVFALVNKFGVSVIAALLEQAEKLYPSDDTSSEWSNFIVTLVELIGDMSPCVTPCQPMTSNTLKQHLSRISSLKSNRYKALQVLLTNSLIF